MNRLHVWGDGWSLSYELSGVSVYFSVCSMMVVYFPMKCLGNEGIPILEQPSANKIFIGSWSDGDVHGCFPSFKFRFLSVFLILQSVKLWCQVSLIFQSEH